MILSNAMLVLPDGVLHGSLHVEDGLIRDLQPGPSRAPGALDLEGDFLLPGIVDLHTDNLERQVQPRANARWPSRSAFLAHDGQCAVAGVTTVLDALCLGDAARPSATVSPISTRWRRRGCCAPSTSCTCAASCRRPT